MTLHNQNESTVITIGRNIRRWREFRELSGENLAHAIGRQRSQISKIENGQSPEISFRTLEKIAFALGLSSAQLLFSNPQAMLTAV